MRFCCVVKDERGGRCLHGGSHIATMVCCLLGQAMPARIRPGKPTGTNKHCRYGKHRAGAGRCRQRSPARGPISSGWSSASWPEPGCTTSAERRGRLRRRSSPSPIRTVRSGTRWSMRDTPDRRSMVVTPVADLQADDKRNVDEFKRSRMPLTEAIAIAERYGPGSASAPAFTSPTANWCLWWCRCQWRR